MATRSIVTFHPDIACEVCGRRLLRGEQPDVFLSDGQRRLVCELCAPRAAHEGWRRESEQAAIALRASRSRRGRSLLGRLRQLREPARGTARALDGSEPPRAPAAEDLYDFLDSSSAGLDAEAGDSDAGSSAAPASGAGHDGDARRAPWEAPAAARPRARGSNAASAGPVAATARTVRAATGTSEPLRRALEAFNASEHPRRVAGVARSLGAPSIRVTASADAAATVVVAWELCWYRYEADLDGEQPVSWRVAQGMELDELPAEDRVANAVADERGELALQE